ncbi:SDR family NAD(P)-dependent oxidoreductase [Halocatena pleomorpha]|uniref:SDR family NAD(P)-dependent oxidoreductase n=2 Tax=Halocatena pleomorpha TaxID=1785090 RepID=A0A3P3RDY3_9EURY|nr:SDR family NAD(P)-dependent oxidoreductase [Halocatena pleomorpha]RRJ31554.1 SDR family NAD(P)-dependent oxidoreductase [Halocatena pleomorpha]
MVGSSEALDGSVALVTGASSGIGEATVEALADEGARIALAARRESQLRELADRIEADGGDALVVPTDVTDESDVQEMVETTHEAFGRLDILVNNAGVMLLEPLEDADTNNLQQMVDVNLMGLMNATHAALPILQEQGHGHIVNVSSVAGRQASPNASGYNATKFGVNGFTDALRQEVTQDGIRTTLIEPGVVDTELQDHIPDENAKESIEDWVESMDPLTSDDIARAIHYAVTQPQHVSVNEILIRPTQQQ